jgi:hypothetical protein
VSVTGFQQSIGGKQALIKKSANGTVVGDSASKKIRRVDVRFKFKGFASVRESTVTLSGSVPWEMMYRVLARLVPEVKSLKFKITNTAVRFYLKKVVRIEHIGRQRVKFSNANVRYEPELFFAKLSIKFSDGVVVSVFANGTVVAQGRNLANIENRVKSLLEKFSQPYGANVRKAPVAARKNLSKKRMNMIEARYERASNWTNSRNGYYVRPGPNKAPRFYEIPKNPALVRQKVIRAYANAGVNVPPLTRRMLGIAVSPSAPPPRKTGVKKASNWDASPPSGMYIRPGPGGLPKFYKVPKLVKQGKKTVVEAYRKAGVNIPNRVRAVFGISPPGSSPSAKKSPLMFVNDRGIFKIGKLDCMRYKIADLHKFATQKGIPITKKQKKADICQALKKHAGKSPSPNKKQANFVKNGVSYYVLADERRVRRNRHAKAMNSFKVQELKNMILAINSSSNVSSKTKKQLVDLLIERKRTKNVADAIFFNFSASSGGTPPSGDKSPSKASTLSSSQTPGSGSPARVGLNIARNVLGPGFTDSELQNFLNRYKKSPSRLNSIIAEFKGKKLRKLTNAPVESL